MPNSSPHSSSAFSSHRFLMRAGLSACTVYAWIFALQYFYSVSGSISSAFLQVILLYTLAQVVTVLLTPYSAMLLKNGVRRTLQMGVLACVCAFILWGGALAGLFGHMPSFGIVGFALFMGIYRALYWVPYALEKNQTPQIKNKRLHQEVCIALMPAIAGYALNDGSLSAIALLFSGAILLITSLAPLFTIEETYEKYSWKYRETFGELFEPKYDSLVTSAFLEGIQGAALVLIWPLTIFLIVGASYRLLGLVLAITLLIAIPMRSFGNRLTLRSPAIHATLAASAWVLRLLVASPFGVILVDSYSSVSQRTPYADSYAFEQAADNGTYLDEYTVLKEISLALGRVTLCIVGALSIGVFSLPIGLAVMFTFAACAAVASIYRIRNVKISY